MSDNDRTISPSDATEGDDEKADPAPAAMDSQMGQASQGTREDVQSALDPVLAKKEQKLQELASRREAKEISPFDLDLNYIYQLHEARLPLTRKEMLQETDSQVLILTRNALEALG